jgi:hypothetical protein
MFVWQGWFLTEGATDKNIHYIILSLKHGPEVSEAENNYASSLL